MNQKSITAFLLFALGGASNDDKFGIALANVDDINGDGTTDYTTTTLTDPNGNYLFDHLPAGGDWCHVHRPAPAGGADVHPIEEDPAVVGVAA